MAKIKGKARGMMTPQQEESVSLALKNWGTTPRKRGRPRQMAPGRLELRIDPALHAEVAAAARALGQDVSAYVRDALTARVGAAAAELAAWREGRAAMRREVLAAVEALPREPQGADE